MEKLPIFHKVKQNSTHEVYRRKGYIYSMSLRKFGQKFNKLFLNRVEIDEKDYCVVTLIKDVIIELKQSY